MKTMDNLLNKVLLLSLFTTVFAMSGIVQDKAASMKILIESRQFTFHAQTALPASGASRQLTSDYDLKVSNNTIVSYLPFFGRAYSVPYGTTDGGLNFTSTKFEYSVAGRNKGGWEISIRPKDVSDFREFSLTISESGYGTLQAITNNRQPISFTGYVTPIK